MDETKTIRAFFAIELDNNLREQFKKIQQDLITPDCTIKWVNPNKLHLTLKFICHFPLQQIHASKDILLKICQEHPSILFNFNVLGRFPEKGKPTVIWVGSSEVGLSSCLRKLAQAIENALIPLGFAKEERVFTPHVTLGRVKTARKNSTLTKKIETYKIGDNLKQTIDRVTLFQSTLTPAGPIYKTLATFPLR